MSLQFCDALTSCCSAFRYRKYIVEDRYTAIRWAIATAQQRDVVVVAGKGDQDWTEVSDGADGYIRVGPSGFTNIESCMARKSLLMLYQHAHVAD